jgi:hypothetical protein
VRGFLASLPPGTVLETILRAKSQMRTAETVLEAIARVRGELAAAQCELMQLRAAPLPIADLKEMATEAVARLGRCRAGSSISVGQKPSRLPRLDQCRAGCRSAA